MALSFADKIQPASNDVSFASKATAVPQIAQVQSQTPTQSSNPIWSLLSGAASTIKNAAVGGAQEIGQGIQEAQPGSGQGVGGLIGGVGKILGGATQVVFSPTAPVVNYNVGPGINAAGNALANTPYLQGYGKDLATQAPSQNNQPEQILGGIANYSSAAGAVAGAPELGNAVPKVAQTFADTASQVKDFMKTSPEVKAAKLNAEHTTTMGDEIGKISDTIAPKLNAKETKLALSEGRIAPGEDPTLLRDGTPDTVLPSTRQARASFTVHQNIPGAADMAAPELYTALGGKIKELSTGLRPAMDATPITDATITKITNDWQALKAQQLSDPYTPATANLEKLQTNFEQNFLQKSGSDNFGDLWDTRIKYDNSVPTSVKNAHSFSSETLQAQKSIWLQNREILNSAINDAITGMGDVSQKTFGEMNDLYNAQKGIESSYKVPKTGEPSQIKQFTKDHPVMTGMVKAGAKAVGLGAGIHLGEGI